MEVNLNVDATGRGEGRSVAMYPFSYAPVPPKIRVGNKSGHARLAALKVQSENTCFPQISLGCSRNGIALLCVETSALTP